MFVQVNAGYTATTISQIAYHIYTPNITRPIEVSSHPVPSLLLTLLVPDITSYHINYQAPHMARGTPHKRLVVIGNFCTFRISLPLRMCRMRHMVLLRTPAYHSNESRVSRCVFPTMSPCKVTTYRCDAVLENRLSYHIRHTAFTISPGGSPTYGV
jgi:hypothetical protein